MLQIQIDEDMPEHIHVTDTADSRVSGRMHISAKEAEKIKDWFKQYKEMCRGGQ